MLSFGLAEQIFNFLYQDIDGYSVSHNARVNLKNASEFLYGELPANTWYEIVKKVNPKQDGVFFDLGSGTGRVVMLSHLLFDFKKCYGIELLEGLYKKSCEIKDFYEIEVLPQNVDQLKDRTIDFFCKNIFDVNLQEADFLFMNYPFKDSDLFEKIEEKFLKELKPGTKIVTIIRALKDSAFKSLGSQKYQFSWGESTAYFFEI